MPAHAKSTILPASALSLLASAPTALDQLLPNRTASQPVPATKLDSPGGLLGALDTHVNHTHTTNGAGAFISTTDACLDMFSSISGNAAGEALTKQLSDAWKQDPTTALRIIVYARSIVSGAGARHLFLRACSWLLATHPKTLINALPLLVKPVGPATSRAVDAGEGVSVLVEREGRVHGCWKDPLNILLVATKDLDASFVMADLALAHKMKKIEKEDAKKSEKKSTKEDRKKSSAGPADHAAASRQASEARNARAKATAEAVVERLERSEVYRALYVTVVRLFAEQLSADESALSANAGAAISYAGKWAPSEGASVDAQTGLARAIAEELYRGQANVMGRYRALLAKTRTAKKVPETRMKQGAWTKIDYAKVPAKCMSINELNWWKHDADGFERHLEGVAAGKYTIAGATETPGHLVVAANRAGSIEFALPKDSANAQSLRDRIVKGRLKMLNGQWDSMARTLAEEIAAVEKPGKAGSSMRPMIAVVDVSGSMSWPELNSDGLHPLEAGLGLSLLISQLVPAPYKGRIISFSETPRMIHVDASLPFDERLQLLRNIPMGYNTDFERVFDLILDLAKEAKLEAHETDVDIVCFSDMQFDDAHRGTGNTGTLFESIKAKFDGAGYSMPRLVFWNLAGEAGAARPVEADTSHCMLMSGWSGAQMKALLDGTLDDAEKADAEMADAAEDFVELDAEGEEQGKVKDEKVKEEKKQITPREAMLRVLGADAFKDLVVLD